MLRVNRALVADTTQYLANLTANMLRSVGAKSVTTVTDSAAVLMELHKGSFEVMVIDDSLAPIDGVALTRQIRAPDGGANRLMPIIMVFAEASRERIEEARDAGVTEFIKKPMSPKILESRITQAIEKPRAFVEAEAYTGPDRRRREVSVTAEKRAPKADAPEPTEKPAA
jgi:two-component system chemotaxis response regulator CheY